MMKKRTVFAILITLTITAGIFAGCGSSADTVPAGNMTNETGSALKDDESLKDNAAEKKQEDSDQKDTKTQKTTDEKESGAKPESKDTPPAEASAKPADTGAKSDGNDNAGNTQAKPESNTSSKPSGRNSGNSSSGCTSGSGNSGSDSAGGSGNSSSGSTSGSGNSGSAPEAQPEAPAHEHVWQEHTATRQEWVPNIVVVDDYQTQQVVVGCKIECNCCNGNDFWSR